MTNITKKHLMLYVIYMLSIAFSLSLILILYVFKRRNKEIHNILLAVIGIVFTISLIANIMMINVFYKEHKQNNDLNSETAPANFLILTISSINTCIQIAGCLAFVLSFVARKDQVYDFLMASLVLYAIATTLALCSSIVTISSICKYIDSTELQNTFSQEQNPENNTMAERMGIPSQGILTRVMTPEEENASNEALDSIRSHYSSHYSSINRGFLTPKQQNEENTTTSQETFIKELIPHEQNPENNTIAGAMHISLQERITGELIPHEQNPENNTIAGAMHISLQERITGELMHQQQNPENNTIAGAMHIPLQERITGELMHQQQNPENATIYDASSIPLQQIITEEITPQQQNPENTTIASAMHISLQEQITGELMHQQQNPENATISDASSIRLQQIITEEITPQQQNPENNTIAGAMHIPLQQIITEEIPSQQQNPENATISDTSSIPLQQIITEEITPQQQNAENQTNNIFSRRKIIFCVNDITCEISQYSNPQGYQDIIDNIKDISYEDTKEIIDDIKDISYENDDSYNSSDICSKYSDDDLTEIYDEDDNDTYKYDCMNGNTEIQHEYNDDNDNPEIQCEYDDSDDEIIIFDQSEKRSNNTCLQDKKPDNNPFLQDKKLSNDVINKLNYLHKKKKLHEKVAQNPTYSLYIACISGDESHLSHFINSNTAIPINFMDIMGNNNLNLEYTDKLIPPLALACLCGNLSVVKKLLEIDANLIYQLKFEIHNIFMMLLVPLLSNNIDQSILKPDTRLEILNILLSYFKPPVKQINLDDEDWMGEAELHAIDENFKKLQNTLEIISRYKFEYLDTEIKELISTNISTNAKAIASSQTDLIDNIESDTTPRDTKINTISLTIEEKNHNYYYIDQSTIHQYPDSKHCRTSSQFQICFIDDSEDDAQLHGNTNSSNNENQEKICNENKLFAKLDLHVADNDPNVDYDYPEDSISISYINHNAENLITNSPTYNGYGYSLYEEMNHHVVYHDSKNLTDESKESFMNEKIDNQNENNGSDIENSVRLSIDNAKNATTIIKRYFDVLNLSKCCIDISNQDHNTNLSAILKKFKEIPQCSAICILIASNIVNIQKFLTEHTESQKSALIKQIFDVLKSNNVDVLKSNNDNQTDISEREILMLYNKIQDILEIFDSKLISNTDSIITTTSDEEYIETKELIDLLDSLIKPISLHQERVPSIYEKSKNSNQKLQNLVIEYIVCSNIFSILYLTMYPEECESNCIVDIDRLDSILSDWQMNSEEYTSSYIIGIEQLPEQLLCKPYVCAS